MTKSFKKSLAFILSVVMLLSVMPAGLSFAATYGNFTYVVENGTIKLTKYTGSATEVVIPDEIDGVAVTVIGGEVFRSTKVTKVIIGENVKEIGSYSFIYCQKLEELVIPKSVRKINTSAFNNCNALKVINYTGSEEDWSAITVATGNTVLSSDSVTINYNFCLHDIVKIEGRDATCEETGLTEGEKCSKCDEIFVAQEEIPAKGHNIAITFPGGLNVVTPPTCTENGVASQYCSRCEQNVNVTLGAKGHSAAEAVKENIDEADCTNAGSYDSVVYCSACKVELSRDNVVVEALGEAGHKAAEAVKENVNEADCENAGSYDSVVYCSVCEVELDRETVNVEALGHTEVIIPAVAPTCTETGLSEGLKCSVCDKVFKEPQLVKANGHKAGEAVKENEVASTCTVAGSYESVVYCSVCEEELSRETITLDIAAHTAGEVVVENEIAATCEGNGSYQNVSYCTACNVEVSREKVTVEALGHKASEAVKENEVAATCTEAGKYDSVVYCSVCNEEISRETVDVEALDHNYVIDEAKTIPAKCEKAGTTVKVCSRCGDTELEPINPLGHNEITVEAKDPTCTEDGHNAYVYCDRAGCGYSTLKVIESTGHISGAPATCTEDQVCTVCNEVIVSAKGHTEVTLAAEAPTCTAEGKKEGKACSTCKKVLVPQEIIPALKHDFVIDESLTVSPTCTKPGSIVSKCSRCDASTNTVIEATGHTLKSVEGVDATCTEAGYADYEYCTVEGCGYTTYVAIEAPGHTAGPEATCTEDQICTVCDYVIASKLNHLKVTTPGQDATCTTDGFTSGESCSRCKEVFKAVEIIEKKGHTDVSVAATPATCTEDGLSAGVQCSVCGTWSVPQTVLPATGHNEVDIPAVSPTCTTKGSTAGRKCANCDEIYLAPMELPALSHNIVDVKGKDATCTETGLTPGRGCNRLGCDFVLVAQEVIPMKEHAFVTIPGKPATCTEDGNSDKVYCESCGKVEVETVVTKATGHTYGPAATCTAPQICLVCNDVLAQVIPHTPGASATCTMPQYCVGCDFIFSPALGHDMEYDMNVTNFATCETDGYEKGHCKRCTYAVDGKTYATGHRIDNWQIIEEVKCDKEGSRVGYCLNCKYNITEVIPAVEHMDGNGDKKCDFCGKSMGGIVIPGGDKEEDKEDEDKCSCNCHAIGIRGLIFDFILFLQRLFGLNKTCKCGEAHY